MGIGDILFIIPIIKELNDEGYNITWPINPDFLNIQKNFKYINFVDKNTFNIDYDITEIIDVDEFTILPVRFSNNLLGNGNPITCLPDKYKFFDVDLNKWRNLKWDRDYSMENKLYYDVLGLSDDEEYNLINDTYSMNQKITINYDNNIKNINCNLIDGFNLLDWYKVIENATNIYTVGTSIIFLIEVIPTNKLKNYFLYPRKPIESNCDNYNYLLNKVTKEII